MLRDRNAGSLRPTDDGTLFERHGAHPTRPLVAEKQRSARAELALPRVQGRATIRPGATMDKNAPRTAWVMALGKTAATTATPWAPEVITSRTRAAVIPPIAIAGISRAVAASTSRPRGSGNPSLVEVACTGPTPA